MFSARYADVDPDINPELIRSKLIRAMIGQYDCLTEEEGDSEIYFLDPYGNYFFTLSDNFSKYELSTMDYIPDGACEEDISAWFRGPSFAEYCRINEPVYLPICRMIYVVPHQRGKGFQRKLIKELMAMSDKVGEGFALFADPFVLDGPGRQVNAREAFLKMLQSDLGSPDNYQYCLWKQRNSFLSYGLKNVKCNDSNFHSKEQYKSFVYVNAQAGEKERRLFEELELVFECPTFDND
tara:strand:+ start:2104 stop:2817 length:714 start_codon:yes stop_codon:yes gene_type:complete